MRLEVVDATHDAPIVDTGVCLARAADTFRLHRGLLFSTLYRSLLYHSVVDSLKLKVGFPYIGRLAERAWLNWLMFLFSF